MLADNSCPEHGKNKEGKNMAVDNPYGALALLPPLVAIMLAIWKRQVIASLLVGVWIGATIINGWNPLVGLLETFSNYLIKKSLADSWNIGIIVFCLAIGGMIGVISKMGGTIAIAEAITKRATNCRSTQMAAALMGVAIFFDDYANSMIVGNTMRPITDRENISREKLAYIVDSTAAPISSLAPISTWIAMELGLIAAGLKAVKIQANPMAVFVQTIPYRFYSLFGLAMVFILIWQKRDYGKMLQAEIRARKTGQVFAENSTPLVAEDKDLLPDEGTQGSVWDAIIPILSFLVITIVGLWYNGHAPGKGIREAFGDADASVVLNWAAFISSMIAIGLGLCRRRFTLGKAMDAWVTGVKTMMVAGIILALAFALKSVISDMHLAKWLVATTQGLLSGQIVPVLAFVLAIVISFATGTSWGTNSILMPIVIPIAAAVSGATDTVTPLMIATIGSVLTGAVFGDHCSPISDTTILSSMASGSDHVDHVKTQLPYVCTAGVFAIIFGFFLNAFGVSPWICLPLGIGALWLFVRFVGDEVDSKGEIIA
jgi:Na+/H+ antiporter NhaC